MLTNLNASQLKDFLDSKVEKFNKPDFIPNDPICIPHLFSTKQDIEIMGFWAAMLAWGQRKTIISKCKELIDLMDGNPYDFVKNHTESDIKPFLHFKHRTFNDLDTLYFLNFFKQYYHKHDSLENAFLPSDFQKNENIEAHLIKFRQTFFDSEIAPKRTRKHISSPTQKSACKRLCMFLRWMVRDDDKGVDFGIWKNISPRQLICPCDVHVDRVARNFGLITRPKTDWNTALELTKNLKSFDPIDPVKYDFALFGIGIENKVLGVGF